MPNKTDASIHNICIAAIRRHTIPEAIPEFQFTSFYPTPAHVINELSDKLNVTLHNIELCLCSTIIDAQNWSVLTTQRMITCIDGKQQEGNMWEAKWSDQGKLKDFRNPINQGKITFKDGSEMPFIYENGKASMVMIYGVKTLMQVLS